MKMSKIVSLVLLAAMLLSAATSCAQVVSNVEPSSTVVSDNDSSGEENSNEDLPETPYVSEIERTPTDTREYPTVPETVVTTVPETDEPETETNTPEIPVEQLKADFDSYISSGAYERAAALFTEHFRGNVPLESYADKSLSKFLDDNENNLLNGKITSDAAKSNLNTVSSFANTAKFYTAKVKTYAEKLKTISDSKDAFEIGKMNEDFESWAEAIASYRLVIKSDCNYETAVKRIAECMQKVKTAAFEKADGYVKMKDYISAIEEINNYLKINDADSEAKNKLSAIQSAYINGAIDEAKKLFVTPATDYQKALDVINKAIQQFPDNEKLLEKKQYYTLFIPVSLYDMDAVGKTSFSFKSMLIDNYNVEHYGCLHTYSDDRIVFELNGAYNTLRGQVFTIAADYLNKEIEIYGDGVKFYENHNVDPNKKSVSISLNITGVNELEIRLIHATFSDTLVQRTEK